MDFIKKAMLLGLGAISLTREKAEELVDELIKLGEATKEEKSKIVTELLKDAEKQENELARKIAEAVQRVVADLGLSTRKDLEEILRKLEEMEKQISQVEEKVTT